MEVRRARSGPGLWPDESIIAKCTILANTHLIPALGAASSVPSIIMVWRSVRAGGDTKTRAAGPGVRRAAPQG